MTQDEAVALYRKMTADEFYRELAQSSEFKIQIEAAYFHDPSFVTVDAAGWRSTQFNVDVPPAQPNEYDPFGPGADPEKIERMKPISGASFPS